MSTITFTRTFHPIGQGSFNTEIFSCNNIKIAKIVYDCGTNSSQQTLKNEIDKTFDKNDEIDILFLSHLHADHISGVEYLKQRCKIKTVVLPLLDYFEKVIVELDLTLHNIGTKIINPEQYFGSETSIVYIYKSDNEGRTNNLQLILDGLKNKQEVRSGTTIKMNKISFWKYTPFNMTNHGNYNQFKILLKEKGIDEHLLYDVCYFEANKKSLRSCYATIYSDLNKSSLLVYSENEECYSVKNYCNEVLTEDSIHSLKEDQTGCLYTGDANLSQKEQVNIILDRLIKYKNTIGIFQVPHHGSRDNMYQESFDLIPSNHYGICVVSAGSKRSKHPSKELLGELLYYGAFPFLVTENEKTKVWQIIKFSSHP